MEPIGVIVNSKAKNAECIEDFLKVFSEKDIPLQVYRIQPDALEESIKNAQSNHPTILVAGGDATIRSAAQHCINSSTLLGILPLGTMNHFVKELKLPTQPEEIVSAIQKNSFITVDTAEVNGYIFINNSTLGFYPSFAKRRDFYSKRYNKWLSYFPSFMEAFRHHQTYSMELKGKDFNKSIRSSFLLISNNLYSYGFPLNIERSSFTNSQLGIYYFKHGKLSLSKIIRYFFNNIKNFEILETNFPLEINVKGCNMVMISVDGDTLETSNPLMYRSRPKSLTLLTNNT